MKCALRSLILTAFLLLTAVGVLQAAAPDPWEDYDEVLFMDMTFEQNLNTPAQHGGREKRNITAYLRGLGENLSSRNYIVDLGHDPEVMVVTLPTDDLFLPNDTLLWARGLSKFEPLLELLRPDPGMYKLLFMVHTDNTGTPGYNQHLSEARMNSIYDWLLENVNEDQVIIPFAMGDADPLEPNTTRKGRAANRRLEIYFIPGPEMIMKARRGKL